MSQIVLRFKACLNTETVLDLVSHGPQAVPLLYEANIYKVGQYYSKGELQVREKTGFYVLTLF